MTCPAHWCPLDDHTECWAEYNRQEDADKYTIEPPC